MSRYASLRAKLPIFQSIIFAVPLPAPKHAHGLPFRTPLNYLRTIDFFPTVSPFYRMRNDIRIFWSQYLFLMNCSLFRFVE